MLCLIDGDILRYRIGFACETHYYDIYAKGDEDRGILHSADNAKDRDEWIRVYIGSKDDVTIKERFIPDPVENCLHSVKMQLEFILSRTGATAYRIFLSGKGNFRDSLVDYYKANRKDARKPFHYDNIGKYLIENWKAEVVNGQEADDALGIFQYTFLHSDSPLFLDTIICTIDKDLNNIPGWHYNFVKDEKYWVDEDEALRNFYAQLLEGDSSDNIPGLGKITGTRIKSWKKVLEPLAYCETEEQMWDYIVQVYNEYGIDSPENKLEEIGQLLWIRREKDEMWIPPV